MLYLPTFPLWYFLLHPSFSLGMTGIQLFLLSLYIIPGSTKLRGISQIRLQILILRDRFTIVPLKHEHVIVVKYVESTYYTKYCTVQLIVRYPADIVSCCAGFLPGRGEGSVPGRGEGCVPGRGEASVPGREEDCPQFIAAASTGHIYAIQLSKKHVSGWVWFSFWTLSHCCILSRRTCFVEFILNIRDVV